ncbi:MAG: P4 family phage/plasmid primase-like protein [Acidimicrobiales bacterium]
MRYSTISHAKDNVPVKRDEPVGFFHGKLKRDLKVADKNGTAIVGAVFRTGGLRRLEDMDGATCLILDIDNGVTQPEDIIGLFPYEGVAYSSYSSTPDYPRFKLVLPFKNGTKLDVDSWKDLWDWADKKVGSSGVLDRDCRQPVALYYLPRVPDEDALEAAWIKPMHGEYLNPREILRGFPGKAEGRKLKRFKGESSFQEAKEVIEALPSDLCEDRGKWIKVGMAMHELENGSDRCLDLWDGWSSHSDKYIEGECAQKWRGFSEKSGDSVTLGTLKRWLSESGIKTKTGKKRREGGTVAPPENVIAKQLMEKHTIMTSMEGVGFEYDSRIWRHLHKEVLNRYCLDADGETFTKSSRRAEITSFIRATTVKDTDIKWNQLADAEVALQDVVLDCAAMETRGHVPEDYLDRCIPWPWDPTATCPTWMEFLDTTLGDDEAIDALQEFFGYIMLPKALYKKALICYGASDTGKSVVGHVARMMCDPYTCSIPLGDMDDAKMIAPIKGKALNLVSELPNDAMIADGGFKQLVSTGEAVAINQKYEPIYMYVPGCKHMVLTNVLPRVNDMTMATFNRMLIVNFDNVVPKDMQDPQLPHALRREMSGIVRWGATGAQRLVARGGFAALGKSEAQVDEYRRGQNPLGLFIDEHTLESAGGRILMDELRTKMNDWLDRAKPYSPVVLGRMAAQLGLKIERHRDQSGKARRYVIGRVLDYSDPRRGANSYP